MAQLLRINQAQVINLDHVTSIVHRFEQTGFDREGSPTVDEIVEITFTNTPPDRYGIKFHREEANALWDYICNTTPKVGLEE